MNKPLAVVSVGPMSSSDSPSLTLYIDIRLPNAPAAVNSVLTLVIEFSPLEFSFLLLLEALTMSSPLSSLSELLSSTPVKMF